MARVPWFRFYTEVLHDPKIHRLPVITRWRWVEVLCLANDQEPRGRIPDLTDVAFALRVSEPKAKSILRSLSDAGLLDTDECGRLWPHNWDRRQFISDDVTARVQRHRERSNVSQAQIETLHATPPETDTESEAYAEEKRR